MRFVFVLSSFQLYGGVLLIIEYANRLVLRNHSVQIFTPGGTVDPALKQRLHPSVELVECSARLADRRAPGKLVHLLWSMARELPPADVVVATHTPTTAAVLLASIVNLAQKKSFRSDSSRASSSRVGSSRFGLPSTPSSQRPARAWLYMDYPEMFKSRWIERLLLRFAPRWFDVLWTISAPLKEMVSAHTDAPIVVTGSGLPNADLLFSQQRIQLADGRKQILYVGTALPRKGLREFLMAMGIVHEQHQNCIIVVVGTEDCRLIVEQSELGQSASKDVIEFHSQLSDLALGKLYASSDLYVSASWGEGLGYPPLEAMICGTPVVLTDSGGVRDYAEHEQNCLLVPPKDVPTMAAAIERVLGDEELARHLSENGVQTAKRYDWKSVGDRVEESAYRILR